MLLASAHAFELRTDALKLVVDPTGQITSIFDSKGKTEYLPAGKSAPLLALRIDGEYIAPVSAQWNAASGLLTLGYGANGKATVEVKNRGSYLTFEVKQVDSPRYVELALWGPYPTTIKQTVGECVGVVRDGKFAFGVRALNTKTIGGYPTEESDIDPSFDIFATNSLADVADDVKVLYRGQAAKHTDFGSVVQAYCRDRSKERVFPMWGHDRFTAPAYDDGGVIGSKIALFGCPEPKALDYLEKIVLGEGLPYPKVDGVWSKKSPTAAQAYIIYPFNESNIDGAIAFTKRTGLKYLYHGGPFATWGHFTLNPKEFPSGWDGLKACVDRAAESGVKLGVHTLSNFTTPTDAYVTPVPDKGLARVGASTLGAGIDAAQKEIVVESPDFFNQMKNNTLHTVVVGDELIRYEKVSESAPWTLLGCERGAWGTSAAAHGKGDSIAKLLDHPYKVFLTDIDLTKQEARNIADLFNKTGIMQISFDGLEGAWSTGLGQYGLSLMIKEWYDHLEPQYRDCINDASMTTHYNWTIFTRMNWGEPWYGGFRESQTNYRLMNQDFYRRNLIPCMLGWFRYTETTGIEDVEWLLARSAAFDAGYTLTTNERAVERNGLSDRNIHAIRIWERARLGGAFPAELKREMEHIANEYTLEEVSETAWNLYPYALQRFAHKNVLRQPGEPVQTKWEFNNPNKRQHFQFLLTTDEPVEQITLAVGGHNTVTIDARLEKGQTLKYDGQATVTLYDRNWKALKTFAVDPATDLIAENGANTLTFTCQFESEESGTVKAEIKTLGEPVALKATR